MSVDIETHHQQTGTDFDGLGSEARSLLLHFA